MFLQNIKCLHYGTLRYERVENRYKSGQRWTDSRSADDRSDGNNRRLIVRHGHLYVHRAHTPSNSQEL